MCSQSSTLHLTALIFTELVIHDAPGDAVAFKLQPVRNPDIILEEITSDITLLLINMVLSDVVRLEPERALSVVWEL